MAILLLSLPLRFRRNLRLLHSALQTPSLFTQGVEMFQITAVLNDPFGFDILEIKINHLSIYAAFHVLPN